MSKNDKLRLMMDQLKTAKVVINPVITDITAIGMAESGLDHRLWEALDLLHKVYSLIDRAQYVVSICITDE